MRPRRVLLVVGQLQMGGAERQLFELAVRLDPGRYAVSIACLSDVSEPFAGLLAGRGLRVEVLRRAGHLDAARVLRLAGMMSRERIDLVHSFLLAANAYAWAASRLAAPAGGPRARIASSRTCIPPRGRWSRTIHGRAFRTAAAVVANSRRVMEFTRDLYAVDQRRIRVIPNGVDMSRHPLPGGADRAAARRELGLDDSAVVVGSVGRLSPEKNPALFLEAAGTLAGRHESLRFVVVGDGPERRALEARAGAGALQGRVLFAGAREDVARILPAFDMLVSSSDTEGMPNAVMEAMASGLPVVATRVGGTEEVLADGVTGYLVERGDREKLVERVEILCADEAARRRLGANGRARIENGFTVETMVAATSSLYDETLR